jgi:hypothetical protein
MGCPMVPPTPPKPPPPPPAAWGTPTHGYEPTLKARWLPSPRAFARIALVETAGECASNQRPEFGSTRPQLHPGLFMSQGAIDVWAVAVADFADDAIGSQLT